MIFRALDDDGDWMLGNGRQSFLTGADAIGLNVVTRIRSVLGDSFSNPDEGIDYPRLLERGTKGLLDQEVIGVALKTEGVIGIAHFDSSVDDRDYSAQMSINTVEGLVNTNA